MLISPCKECKKREYKCHASCEMYKAWKEEVDKEREYLQQESEKRDIVFESRPRRRKH